MPGRDFLQIPGPTNIPERIRMAMARAPIDHRGVEFSRLTRAVLPKLRRIFRTAEGAPIIHTSSGTGGLESSLVNTLSPGDRVLATGIGYFSHLYARIAARLGCEVELIERPWGSGLPIDAIEAALSADSNHEIKAVLTTHNETSTGITTDVVAVRSALDSAHHPALLFVDTVSGLASIDFRFDEWGVDVAISASQKGLLLPPGLAVLCVSEKALAAQKTAGLARHYFDWSPILKMNEKGFFPGTPAMSHIIGLDEALDMLFEEGLEQVFARHARLAEGIRRGVRAWGLHLLAERPEDASDTVTAIRTPEGFDAEGVIRLAGEKYGLALGVGIGHLNGKVFRIGHLGSLNELEVLAVLGGVEMVLCELGLEIAPGSGVAACQMWFLAG